MLFQNYGSFLTVRQKNETTYRYNKPYIKSACIGLCFFALGSLVTAGIAFFHASYNIPHSIVPQATYSKAKASSDKVNKNISVLKSVRPNNIEVCKVVDIVSDSVKRANGTVTIQSIQVNPKTYNLTCIGKDLESANDFLKTLSFDANYDKQLTNIRNKNSNMMPRPNAPGAVSAVKEEVEFSVVITPRQGAKKPAVNGQNIKEGGNK